MRKKLNDKTTISNLRVNTARFVLTVLLSSTAFKMNSIDSLANTNDTVISLEKETIYISENTYNAQFVDDVEVMTLAQNDEALVNKWQFLYEYGYDAATDTKINTDFNITTNNKTYETLSADDFKLFQAVVAAESSKDHHDALAVASSILNRCDDEKWINYLDNKGYDGRNPIEQITLPGQYSVYFEGNYEVYLDDKNVPQEVKDACRLAWYQGIRSHKYVSFRGRSDTEYSDNQVVENGNRFNDVLIKPQQDKTIVDIVMEPLDRVNNDVKQKIKVVE